MDTSTLPVGINITNVLLTAVGFLIVYILNGIKTEIRETKEEIKETNDLVRNIEKDFSGRHSELDKRVTLLEDRTQSLTEV